MKKTLLKVGVCSSFLFATSAFALPPATVLDLSTGIDFSSISLGILAIAGLMAAVYVVWKGARMVVSAIRLI